MPEMVDTLAALDLARYVRAGDTVLWGQACAEPVALTTALMAQRARIGRFRCFLGIPASDTVTAAHADLVSFLAYTGSGGNAALYQTGALDVLPVHYSHLPALIRNRTIAIDVVLLLLAPPDASGRYSLGLAEDYLPAALDGARVVIAEVNDQVPQTRCARVVTDTDLDVIVRASRPPLEVPRPEPGPIEQAIAAHAAGLIEDGATLQIGIGRLPEAILRQLGDRRDLGVHSGLLGDAAADLMAAGAITNARKSLDRGRAVAGFLYGSRRLFAYAHRNPAIELRATEYTHDPEVLAAQERLVALNTALEVDLSGQVNAEVAGGRYLGAVGGAVDFLRGAARARGGLPIVALPAARVVARLTGPVSTARSDAGLVVTEFGVADLRGQPLRERAARLLAIAPPDRRAALEAEVGG
ncbi:MAG TPA: acetyl-CoA hydrolase/transferase C-terminal domain-containing protein [Ktedonobacterales bacterium]|nr:acetyl-CoA hydrolase/transferase C-terminal domain-containing protein [Ktedonobacterales bacterium]